MTAPECDEAVKWLDEHFLRSFQDEADPSLWPDIGRGCAAWFRRTVLRTGDSPRQRGFFSITVLSLIYCTAMAGLRLGKGGAGSKETIEYIENHVGAAAGGEYTDLYKERGAFLYVIFRHRLVHQREPGQAELNGATIKWAMARFPEDDRMLHLRYHQSVKGGLRFWVHADVLYEHVLASFLAIRAAVEKGDAGLARRILDGAKDAASAKPLVKDDLGAYALAQVTAMLPKRDADPTIVKLLDQMNQKMKW